MAHSLTGQRVSMAARQSTLNQGGAADVNGKKAAAPINPVIVIAVDFHKRFVNAIECTATASIARNNGNESNNARPKCG